MLFRSLVAETFGNNNLEKLFAAMKKEKAGEEARNAPAGQALPSRRAGNIPYSEARVSEMLGKMDPAYADALGKKRLFRFLEDGSEYALVKDTAKGKYYVFSRKTTTDSKDVRRSTQGPWEFVGDPAKPDRTAYESPTEALDSILQRTPLRAVHAFGRSEEHTSELQSH